MISRCAVHKGIAGIRHCFLLFWGIGLVISPACSLPKANGNQKVEIAKTVPKVQAPVSIEFAQLLTRICWVIGDSENLYKSTDGGNSWPQIYSVAPQSGKAQKIMGFSFIDPQTGFLIVDGQLLRTEDGGTTWSQVGTIGSGTREIFFESCYFIDHLRGWAVGGIWQKGWVYNPRVPAYTGAVFATQDGGKTWQQQRIDIPAGYFEEGKRWSFRNLFFSDARTGWAVGNGVIFWTIDGGQTWHLANARQADYKYVCFSDNQNGWAIQREGSEFVVTSDGGRTWNWVYGPPPYGARPVHIVFLTHNHGFAALLGLYETRDGGQSWVRTGIGDEDNEVYDYLSRTKDGAMITLRLDGDGVNAFISTDEGVSWQSANLK